jgi:hypothetical protein
LDIVTYEIAFVYFYLLVSDGQVTKVVGNMVQKLWKDKRKRDTFEDVYTEVKKQATVKKVMEASKVPPGLVDDAFDLIVASPLDTSTFHKHNLTTQIDSPSRLALFRQSLTSNFNAAWDHAVSSQRAVINASTEPRQSTSTTVHPLSVPFAGSTCTPPNAHAGDRESLMDSIDSLPEEDEEEISAMMEKDAKDRATKRLRTITVQLKDIVRADLLTEIVDDESTDEVTEKSAKRDTAYEKCLKLLGEKQLTLTNAFDELAFLGRKTTLVVRSLSCAIPV